MILPIAAFISLAATCAPDVSAETLAAVARVESDFSTLSIYDNTSRQSYEPKDKDQAEGMQRAAVEADQVRADALHQQDKDARLDAILEQIARNDQEKHLRIRQGFAERFGRPPTPDRDEGRERERDRGYELER